MKKSDIKNIVTEELKRFVEWFSLNESELQQSTTVMPDELPSIINKIKQKDKYKNLTQTKSGNLISFQLNGDEVMSYDSKEYKLHHNFLPSSIADKL